MDFTREPIIETIITPKEGYKLVIRSSKSAGQEEYFVDAVEIVTFGNALFFRSLERPKAFLLPVSDYEALEVREARMVLKTPGLDRSIKIGGGREAGVKVSREAEKEAIIEEIIPEEIPAGIIGEERSDIKIDKKRDRRRHYRKRKGREEKEEGVKEEVAEPVIPPLEDEKINLPTPEKTEEGIHETTAPLASTLLSSLLQPPPKLISETISLYRQNDLFKGAFYLSEEDQYKPHDKVQELLSEEDEEISTAFLQEPAFVMDEEEQKTPVLYIEKQEEYIEQQEEYIEQQEESVEELKLEEKPMPFEEEEPEPGLPLHPEEDTNITSTEESYFSESEESLENNHQASHNRQKPS